MKKLVRWLYVPLFAFTVSCAPVKLSNEEAMRLIKAEKNYPELVSVPLYDIAPDTGLGREIERLIKEGYIIRQSPTYGQSEPIADKGKGLVASWNWNYIHKIYNFSPFIYKRDVMRINEILIDSQNKTATVKYEVGYSNTEYYDALVKLDTENIVAPRATDYYMRELQNWTTEIQLKKWDQGWRVAH